MNNIKDILDTILAEAALFGYITSKGIIVPCAKCKYLRKRRACNKCMHPNGLREPKPDEVTFCCYGIEK
jgi:hypothetical protein